MALTLNAVQNAARSCPRPSASDRFEGNNEIS